jgi:hypothetical protein
VSRKAKDTANKNQQTHDTTNLQNGTEIPVELVCLGAIFDQKNASLEQSAYNPNYKIRMPDALRLAQQIDCHSSPDEYRSSDISLG